MEAFKKVLMTRTPSNVYIGFAIISNGLYTSVEHRNIQAKVFNREMICEIDQPLPRSSLYLLDFFYCDQDKLSHKASRMSDPCLREVDVHQKLLNAFKGTVYDLTCYS